MDEFIFDDELEEVGAEIEAHCPRCRLDTSHVVVTKYEDEVRRVQCSVCSETHSFRKPRGDADDELEPKQKKAARPKPTWEQVMQKSKKTPRPYSVSDSYGELDVIDHPKFGMGYVTDHLGLDKIEVTFQNEVRVLIHNRKNLNLPLLQGAPPPNGNRKRSTGRARPQAKAARPAVQKKPAKAATAKTKTRAPASKPKRVAAPAKKAPNAKKAKKASSAKRKK